MSGGGRDCPGGECPDPHTDRQLGHQELSLKAPCVREYVTQRQGSPTQLTVCQSADTFSTIDRHSVVA